MSIRLTTRVWQYIDASVDNAAALASYPDIAEAYRVIRQAGWDQLPSEVYDLGADLDRIVEVTLYEPQWRMIIDYQEEDLTRTAEWRDSEDIARAHEAIDAVKAGLERAET